MSAYLVSPDTINLIVSAAVRFSGRGGFSFYPDLSVRDVAVLNGKRDSLNPNTDAELMAALLWAENVHSVAVRYPHDTASAPDYRFRPVDLDYAATAIDPAILVLGSIRCLRYQSCEAADYRDTNAAKLLDWIEALCIDRLIRVADAPWGWEKAWTEERRAAIRAKIQAA